MEKGNKKVAGLDEAGRGPLAGPVVAAAVSVRQFTIFNLQFSKVNDSKKLSPRMREKLYELITKNKNIQWGLGVVSEKIIDKINIKNAAELAMEKAVKNLKSKIQISSFKIDYLIIDGNQLKNKYLKLIPHKLIIKGDAKVFSVAVASILAKVVRDKIMMRYHKKYPQYRFDLHKGYGTKLHLAMLHKYGACRIHRKSFAPVTKVI